MNDSTAQAEDVRASENSTPEVSDVILTEIAVRAELSKISEELDLNELILPSDYAKDFQVKPLKGQLSIKKPGKETFIRTKPAEDWVPVCAIEDKIGGSFYVVHPRLFGEPFIIEESTVSKRLLAPAIDRNGDEFLWPLKMPEELGRVDHWADSAIDIARKAVDSWTRVFADMNAGKYRGLVAQGNLPEPNWSDESSRELVQRALKGRVINSMDHPVIKKLQGVE